MIYEIKRADCPTPMIKTNINTAASWLTIIALSIISGCAIVPTRNTLTINKTIDLDERALDDLDIGIRMEWIR